MANIEGYSQLGLVGFTDKGDYAAGSIYMMNDLVHYQNSIWKCKEDQTSGVTPGENNNWTVFVNGTKELNAIITDDVYGLLGAEGAQGINAQELINAIAEKVATKVLMKTDLVTQIVNDATKAASMAALYAVNEKIGDVASLPNEAADVVAAIVQQNSNLIYCKTVAVQIVAEAGLTYNETVAHGLSPNKVIAYFIGSVTGSSSTSDITFCHMLGRDTIRIISARSQDVTVMVGYIYSK